MWAVPKKCPPGPTSAIASNASESSSTTTGSSVGDTMCSRSASITIFSKLACRPPSIQPAPCIMKLHAAHDAPHSENIDSYAAWASTALAAHMLQLRYGTR